MTTSTTSQDVKEIQDRQSAGRGAVIDATMVNGVTVDPKLIEAAMMALVEHWRAEADIWEASKKRGSVGTAKEIRAAASRLAGFAVGLTTRPIGDIRASCAACMSENHTQCPGTVASGSMCWCYQTNRAPGQHPRDHHPMTVGEAEDATIEATLTANTIAQVEACSHPADARSVRQDLSVYCTACQTVVAPGDGSAIVIVDDPLPSAELPGMWETADLIGGLTDALPDGDPVRDAFADDNQTPEQNLRDIIGPLGASSVAATIDHPFTSPSVPWLNRRPVATLAYPRLAEVATATAGTRDHVSHSYVESYENCSLSALLRDASRFGQVGAQRPGWSQIGGSAFHAAVEAIERAYLAGVVMTEAEAIWNTSFDTAVKTKLDELVGTPYADSATWYVSNRGKEGFDWWRVEGARMLRMYLDKHTPAWREANQVFRVADTTPVIEYPYEMTLRSLDGERGLTAQGFIDMARLNMTTYSLTVIDYKTGSRDPESTFQLGEYGHALLMAMGIPQEPADRPILGRYWLARKGIYTDAVPVLQRHPLDELQYRYDAAMRGTQAKIFSPHTSNLCKSCSSVDYCPTQAGRP